MNKVIAVDLFQSSINHFGNLPLKASDFLSSAVFAPDTLFAKTFATSQFMRLQKSVDSIISKLQKDIFGERYSSLH